MLLSRYQYNAMAEVIECVQTGVRMEKRLVKVLKILADYLDMSLGDLLEGITLHCMLSKDAHHTPTIR